MKDIVPSPRCGKLNCPSYDESNQQSKCKIFTDRNECAISGSQRRKSANHSKKTALRYFN